MIISRKCCDIIFSISPSPTLQDKLLNIKTVFLFTMINSACWLCSCSFLYVDSCLRLYDKLNFSAAAPFCKQETGFFFHLVIVNQTNSHLMVSLEFNPSQTPDGQKSVISVCSLCPACQHPRSLKYQSMFASENWHWGRGNPAECRETDRAGSSSWWHLKRLSVDTRITCWVEPGQRSCPLQSPPDLFTVKVHRVQLQCA